MTRPFLIATAGLLLGLTLGVSGCRHDEKASSGVPFVGWAVGAKPLERANVEIRTPEGVLLGRAEEPTSATGLFTARVPELPADFTVTAEAGGDRLVAEVRGYELYSPVHVNHVTTLVARHLTSRGGSLEESEAAVKRLLKLPGHNDLGTDVRVSDRSFSGAEFAASSTTSIRRTARAHRTTSRSSPTGSRATSTTCSSATTARRRHSTPGASPWPSSAVTGTTRHRRGFDGHSISGRASRRSSSRC